MCRVLVIWRERETERERERKRAGEREREREREVAALLLLYSECHLSGIVLCLFLKVSCAFCRNTLFHGSSNKILLLFKQFMAVCVL